jgi:hypothetical protein
MPNNPTSFRYPLRIPAGTHPDIAETLQNHDDAITDLQQAIPELKSQIAAATAAATNTTTNATNESQTVVVGNNVVGTVNNQTGVTTYITEPLDYGSFIILSSTSAIAVTLSTGVTFTLPWFCTFLNLNTGVATLTPESGTINGGATFTLDTNSSVTVSFDGMKFFADPELPGPQNTPAVSHEFLTGYNAATGGFTAAQPAFTDISGVATTAQIGTGTPAAGDYVDGGTGAWTPLGSGYSLGGVLSGANISLGSGAGTGASVTISGLDGSHVVTLTTGSTPATGSTIWTVVFTATRGHLAYPNICPSGGTTAYTSGGQVILAGSAGTFSALQYSAISGSNALAATTVYVWTVAAP